MKILAQVLKGVPYHDRGWDRDVGHAHYDAVSSASRLPWQAELHKMGSFEQRSNASESLILCYQVEAVWIHPKGKCHVLFPSIISTKWTVGVCSDNSGEQSLGWETICVEQYAQCLHRAERERRVPRKMVIAPECWYLGSQGRMHAKSWTGDRFLFEWSHGTKILPCGLNW